MLHRKREIERFFAYGLAFSEEEVLRAHLRQCKNCRSFYDEQAQVLRALGGNPNKPSEEEKTRSVDRVLAALELDHEPQSQPVRVLPAFLRPAFWPAVITSGLSAGMLLFVFALGAEPTPGVVRRSEATTVNGEPLSTERALLDHEQVVVSKGGMAEFLLADKRALVRAFPGTEFTTTKGGTAVQLQAGKIWCDLKNDGKKTPFVVTTPEGSARVTGTSFFVERIGERTEVRVVHGSVLVSGLDDRGTVRLTRRQRSSIRADAAPTTARSYAPKKDVDAWKNVLRGFFRGVKQAFEKGLQQLDDMLH